MDQPHIIHIEHDGQLLALIIRAQYREEGIHFFTPENFSQQLGFMKYSAGHVIEAHEHRSVAREVIYTQEVLVIRKGRLRADFYTTDQAYVESCELTANDVVLLISGGHGFEVIEPLEMLEIRQGPYLKDKDKIRFEGISAGEVSMRSEKP
jgi:mannose-6-phosphate isomerase-like protein (cupin superfamily)